MKQRGNALWNLVVRNIHNCQSPAAEAEIKELMMADKNILLAQRNAPIIGIVQDGLIGAYLLTRSDTFVSWELVYDSVLATNINFNDWAACAETYYPQYFINSKPSSEKCPGRLFFSMSLPRDFYYTKKNNADPNEPMVIIEDGILIAGQIDKSIIGAKSNSIIHKLAIEYGDLAAVFIDNANFIINAFLTQYGFSIGIGDCFCTDTSSIEDVLAQAQTKCSTLLEEPDHTTERKILGELNSVTSVGQRISVKGGLVHGSNNHIMSCVKSGAKGNYVNISQITAIVGQQNIDGKRVPPILSGGTRSLPHFECGDKSPEAGGFVKSNYINGLNPQETFFHAMSGREGVIDTACKSVVGKTPIIIIERGMIRRVLIGEWIDNLFFHNPSKKVRSGDRFSLDTSALNIQIPTINSKGIIQLGDISAVTSHDPGDFLYKIKTLAGREVIVTESHSLLVWNEEKGKFKRKNPNRVSRGDYVPTTINFPVIPKTTTFNAYHSSRILGDQEFNRLNGFIIGIYIVCGNSYNEFFTEIINNDPTIQKIVIDWLDYHGIKWHAPSVAHYASGRLLNTVTACSSFLASFFKKTCGKAKQKIISPEIFGAPKKFLIGVLDGYISGCGIIKRNSIEASSLFSQIIEGISIICSRLGIFTKVHYNSRRGSKSSISIRGKWADAFRKIVDLSMPSKALKLKNMKCFDKKPPVSGNYADFREQNDVILDRIINIRKIKPGYYNSKVYDLTVPSTLNFGLANGLHVVDTADTGYIERKIGKKCEDCVVRELGTVRNAAGHIIQFLYGGDGFDPSRLCYVESPNGDPQPFFVDVFRIAKRLNVEGYKPESIGIDTIKKILANIKIHRATTKVTRIASNCVCKRLKIYLKEVKVCPTVLDKFEKEIIKAWYGVIACKGESVGLLATSSIGEPTTQSSIRGNERFIYISPNGKPHISSFSDFIDPFFDGEYENTQIADIRGYYVLSVDKNPLPLAVSGNHGVIHEKVVWSEISQVSRHPSNGNLIKITTRSGRSITATLSHSFLKKSATGIAVELGKNLNVGDQVPAYTKIPNFYGNEDIEYDAIAKIQIIPDPKEYVYDLTIPGSQTFATLSGILVHNTLNQFHYAGTDKDVTLGVSRITELLNVSENPKTPGCIIYIKTLRKEKLEKLANRIKNVPPNIQKANKLHLLKYISDIGRIERIVCKDLFLDTPKIFYTEEKMPPISPVVSEFYSYDKFQKEWWFDLAYTNDAPLKEWVIELKFDPDKLYYHRVYLSEIAEILNENDNVSVYCVASPQALATIIVIIDFDSIIRPSEKLLENELLVTHNNLPYFLTRDIVIPVVEKTPIKGIENIKKTYLKQEGNDWVIDTQGSNFRDILTLSFIDKTNTTSDSMWEIYSVLGIEATRKFMVDEFMRVLCYDGGYINIRHVELLVDAMTRKGIPTSATRHGIERSVGPLAKGCFERCLDNFTLSAIYGESDPNKGMSVRIATGTSVLCGTGIVETHLSDSYKEMIKNTE